MQLHIPTIEEIRAVIQEALATQAPEKQGGPLAMKVSKVPDHFIGLSVKQVERWSQEGLIQITRPYPGGDRYIDPNQLTALLRSYDAVTGEKIGE